MRNFVSRSGPTGRRPIRLMEKEITKPMLEVCCASLEDVAAAIEGGADRVELCRDLEADGLTPEYDTVRKAVAMARDAGRPFRVMVLVRSRDGGFIYAPEEKEEMCRSVADIIAMGVDGVVVGSLNPDLTVDTAWTREIVEMVHARNLSVTFHRAFDHVTDFAQALEDLVAAGVDRVLTAGGTNGAERDADTLARLVRQAAGRIVVMPGGGVRSSNIARLRAATRAVEFHSSCRLLAAPSVVSPSEVRNLANALNQQP